MTAPTHIRAISEPATQSASPATATPAIRRVLFAIDQGPFAARALEVGMELAAACGAEVALVHVIDPQLFAGTEAGIAGDGLRAEFERSGRELLAAAAEHLAHAIASPPAWQFLEYGRPVHEIVRVAGEWMADLVVMGTHGRSGVSRVLLGSTSEGVLCHAHRPVLIVPPAE